MQSVGLAVLAVPLHQNTEDIMRELAPLQYLHRRLLASLPPLFQVPPNAPFEGLNERDHAAGVVSLA